MKSKHDSACYKENFLADVIARVDFANPANSLNGSILPEDIQKAIKQRYEIFEPSTAIVQGVELSNKGVSSTTEEIRSWNYHGSEREKTITLTKNEVMVAIKKYRDYAGFKLDFLDPLTAIQRTEGGLSVNRTGLRFINIFKGVLKSLSDVEKYFTPMFSGQFKEIYNFENCSRSFLITEYTYSDIKLRMQTGIYNPDYPARIKSLDFIVDIDAFVDTPHSFENVGELIDRIHAQIQLHFESSITPTMRRKMNAPKRSTGTNQRTGSVPRKKTGASKNTRNRN
jgi:uncharacterized protein (TIGR04255 family)